MEIIRDFAAIIIVSAVIALLVVCTIIGLKVLIDMIIDGMRK